MRHETMYDDDELDGLNADSVEQPWGRWLAPRPRPLGGPEVIGYYSLLLDYDAAVSAGVHPVVGYVWDATDQAMPYHFDTFTEVTGWREVFRAPVVISDQVAVRAALDAAAESVRQALEAEGWCTQSQVAELGDLRATVDQIRRALRLSEGTSTDEIAAAVERLVGPGDPGYRGRQ